MNANGRIVMSHITLHAPAPVAIPRAAPIAAALFSSALAAASRLWRQQLDLRRRARLGREAAALRTYATSVARHDPSLAADLFSAADRHVKED